jgi:beta-glucosidase
MQKSIYLLLIISASLLLVSCGGQKYSSYTESFDDTTNWKAFAGPKSSVEVVADQSEKTEGSASLKKTFSVEDWGGIGFELTERPAWNINSSIAFQIKGDGSLNKISFEITDDGGERFNKILYVTSNDWQTIEIPLKDLIRRKDWQPAGVPDDGLTLTQVEGISFSIAGKGKGTIYLNDLKLVNK